MIILDYKNHTNTANTKYMSLHDKEQEQDIVKTYNQTFTELLGDYLTVANLLRNNETIDNYRSNGTIEFDDIVEFEIALNTLAVQIQNLKYKLQLANNNPANPTNPANTTNTDSNNQDAKQQAHHQTNKLINNALLDFLPFIMLHMMNNDAYSILNNSPLLETFKSKLHTVQHTTPEIKMQKTAKQTTQQQQTTHQWHCSADDVD
jgi:hypothetical protein